jgi:hypothetical protein
MKFYVWNIAFYGTERRTFGNQIVNMFEAVKCGAGEDQLD